MSYVHRNLLIEKVLLLLIFFDLNFAGKKISSRREELRELVEHFNVSFCLSSKFKSIDVIFVSGVPLKLLIILTILACG